jgi:hypothetical protein
MRSVVILTLAVALAFITSIRVFYPTLSPVSQTFVIDDGCAKETSVLVEGQWFASVEQQRHKKACSNDSICLYGSCYPNENVISWTFHRPVTQKTIDNMISLRDQFVLSSFSDSNIGHIMMKAIQKLQMQELRRKKMKEV